ncbi:MAG TPA: hypothetical protein VM103_00660 [Candidatus Paceibacterota bacterium]|nr:hypothetical protein [Candidatus Paceibacterota bacterium]
MATILKRQEKTGDDDHRALPFFVEFVKFSASFAALIAVALITLRFASAAQ